MKPTEQNVINYDLTPLKHGAIYDVTNIKKVIVRILIGTVVLMPLFIVSLVGLAVLTLFNADVFELISLFIGITQVLIFAGFGLAIFLFFRIPQQYKRSVTNFGALNQLTPIGLETIGSYLPPSLFDPGASVREGRGYYLQLGEQRVLFYDYTYTISGGKSSQRYTYAVATLELTKQYPHLYLDGAANGRNLSYTKDQRVDLEGDFNKYFSLYMPEGSAAGSLTVLAPDVMLVLIEQAQPFDIELSQNSLSIITTGRAFTRENLQKLLVCSKALSKEFKELDSNWQPVTMANGKPYTLKRSNWKVVVGVVAIIAMIVIQTVMFIAARSRE